MLTGSIINIFNMEIRLNNQHIVNAWNEWDELEEVVVGSADNACFEPTEPGSHPKLRDSSVADIIPFPSGSKPQEMIEKTNEELAGFAALLESQGVKVHRPEPQDFSQAVRTPDFDIQNQYCAAVSYTHLRAHETSLHLVCRLLLEKKNK